MFRQAGTKDAARVIDRKQAFRDLGRPVYGLAAIALGLIGLVWRDFAAVWQPIENLGPGHLRHMIIADSI